MYMSLSLMTCADRYSTENTRPFIQENDAGYNLHSFTPGHIQLGSGYVFPLTSCTWAQVANIWSVSSGKQLVGIILSLPIKNGESVAWKTTEKISYDSRFFPALMTSQQRALARSGSTFLYCSPSLTCRWSLE